MLLGCIADDFTGATDLANTLVRQAMSTVVLLGVPGADRPPRADAIVVALKSRSIPAAEAVGVSLAALRWLEGAGARQYYFKYCSTFDSTDAGNIGPVAEALLDALGASFSVVCPAFPTNQRTIYRGHLFVGDQLLSESGMRDHPLNPMTDPLLTRVLQRQCRGKVGLIPFDVVERGPAPVRAEMAKLQSSGVRLAVVDALNDHHLVAIGEACTDLSLLTGGSGLALGLPHNFRRQGLLGNANAGALPAAGGHAVVLAGSCSAATQRQVAAMKRECESFAIDPLAVADGTEVAAQALAWATPRLGTKPILIYSTAPPQQVERVQSELGRAQAGTVIEQAFGRLAADLVALGARRMIVAGGETAGAVVTALGVTGLRIGAEIDPGVPWTASLGDEPIALALKSGNFGSDDFFAKAFRKLENTVESPAALRSNTERFSEEAGAP